MNASVCKAKHWNQTECNESVRSRRIKSPKHQHQLADASPSEMFASTATGLLTERETRQYFSALAMSSWALLTSVPGFHEHLGPYGDLCELKAAVDEFQLSFGLAFISCER
jgi:hypothetical protein